MSTENQERDQHSNEVLEEKQIKNAVIDLLHNNEEVTDTALSKATGLSQSSIEKHSEAIKSMLCKLKKIRTASSI